MGEITAVLMFLGLAFVLGFAGLLAYGVEWVINRNRGRRNLENMPERIRRLNGNIFG